MNPEHVSVESPKAPTPFPGIRPTQHPEVSVFSIPSPAVLEESRERRSKQRIIDRALEKIIEQGLCGFEAVKAYLTELYRRDCRPNTLRTFAVTIISFLVYLKSCGVDRLEALLWVA